MALLPRSNNALSANPNQFNYPSHADIANTTHGSNWLWAVTALFALASLLILAFSFLVPHRARALHYLAAAVSLIATLDYFTMASNLGYAAINVEFVRRKKHVTGFTREIYYVRYIDWFITSSLLILATLLTARAPLALILWTLFLTWVLVLTLLIGALVASSYKWGYFVFSLLALFAIAYNLLWSGRRYASRLGHSTISRTYTALASWLVGLWFLYPISWGLSEGGNVIGVVGEMVFYGVLDVLTKLGFVALLLLGHRRIDPMLLGIASRGYKDEVGEKSHGHKEVSGQGAATVPGTMGSAAGTGSGRMTTGTTGGVMEPGVHQTDVHPSVAV